MCGEVDKDCLRMKLAGVDIDYDLGLKHMSLNEKLSLNCSKQKDRSFQSMKIYLNC